MKKIKLILVAASFMVGLVVRGENPNSTPPGDNTHFIKVVDTKGMVVENVVFIFDNELSEGVLYSNGFYLVDIPAHAEFMKVDHKSHPAVTMDLTEVDFVSESQTILITFRSIPKAPELFK